MKLILILSVSLSLCGPAFCDKKEGSPGHAATTTAQTTEQKNAAGRVVHRFHWTHWGWRDEPEAFVDGTSIGKGMQAAKKLAAMKFLERTLVEIDLPDMPKTAFDIPSVNPPYFRAEEFLRKWILQGVQIKFFLKGKPVDFHTLAALDGKNKPVDPTETPRFPPSGETGYFLFDGNKIIDGSDVIKEMAALPWPKDSVLLICPPEYIPDPFVVNRPENRIAGAVDFLECRGVIVKLLGRGFQ